MQRCPTCGGKVTVISTSEGTHHYEPETQRIEYVRDHYRQHIEWTIETLVRADEFPLLEDGDNPLQATIDRLRECLEEPMREEP